MVFIFQVMENAMGTATTTTTPESAVEALMKQVADENGLEITENLASVPSQTIGKFIFQVFFELRIETQIREQMSGPEIL